MDQSVIIDETIFISFSSHIASSKHVWPRKGRKIQDQGQVQVQPCRSSVPCWPYSQVWS